MAANIPYEPNKSHKPDIWLRLSELRDADQLIELDALVWNNQTSPSPTKWTTRAQYLHQCPPGCQLVAGIGDELCGYLGFASPTAMSSHRHVYDIHVAVHPAYQRLGIGRLLMEAMKKLAAEQGVRKLSLRVLSTNPCAIAFYESCGFIPQGRLIEEYYIDGQYVDDILMWCPVIAEGTS
ncbi:N-acyltransferase YncA [compost metagenome]